MFKLRLCASVHNNNILAHGKKSNFPNVVKAFILDQNATKEYLHTHTCTTKSYSTSLPYVSIAKTPLALLDLQYVN